MSFRLPLMFVFVNFQDRQEVPNFFLPINSIIFTVLQLFIDFSDFTRRYHHGNHHLSAQQALRAHVQL